MALTNKLTAIADAIRAKTGGTSPLTLPEMATAISAIPTGANNCKCFTVTVSADDSDSKHILTDADAYIAAHRNDNSFYVGIVPNFAYNSGLSFRGGVNTNIALTDSTTCGFLFRTNSSGSNSFAFITKKPTVSSTDIGVTDDGKLFVYTTTTLVLRTGCYTVFCGW